MEPTLILFLAILFPFLSTNIYITIRNYKEDNYVSFLSSIAIGILVAAIVVTLLTVTGV